MLVHLIYILSDTISISMLRMQIQEQIYMDDEDSHNEQELIQEQMQQERISKQPSLYYLKQSVKNANQALNLSEAGLEELNRQTEIINRIHQRTLDLNDSTDRAEKKIRQIKRPLMKHTLRHTDMEDISQEDFRIEGEMIKYTRSLKRWYRAPFTLTKDNLTYKRVVLPGVISVDMNNVVATKIEKGEIMYDDNVCVKDHVIELCERRVTGSGSKHKYHILCLNDNDTYTMFTNYLMDYLNIEIEGFFTEKEIHENQKDELLDDLLDTLANLQYNSKKAGAIIENHTDNIRAITRNTTTINGNINDHTYSVRRIK